MKKKNKLKIYLPFATNVFQTILSYKANVIIFLFGESMILAISYFLWKAIYESSPDNIIRGFSLNEMIIYILVSAVTSLVVSINISYNIASEVKDGTIAINLVRPISYEKRMMFEALGGVMYNFIVIFIIAFTAINILYYKYIGSLSLFNIFFYFISIILGIFINFYYSYAFGLLSFKITNMWGLSQITSSIAQLLSGALIPIVFFPDIVQRVIGLLPFSSLIYTPTMIYLGKLTGMELAKGLGLQVIWVVILSMVAKAMWNSLVKSLTVLGG